MTVSVPTGAASRSTNTTGNVSGDVGGSTVTGNQASDDLFVSIAPVLTKEFTDDPVGAGGSVTLAFEITNPDPDNPMTDIAFIDELDPVLPIAGLPPVIDVCGTGSALTFGLFGALSGPALRLSDGQVDPGATCSFTVVLDVADAAATGRVPNVTTPVTATLDGAAVTGNAATDDLLIVGAPPIRKRFLDDPVAPGDPVTLQFTIANGGEGSGEGVGDFDSLGPVTDIAFTDDLTFLPGLTAVAPLPTDPCGPGSTLTASVDDTLLTLAGGNLAEDASCTFDVTLQTSATSPQGLFTNTTSNVTATASVTGVTGTEPVTGPGATDDLLVTDVIVTKEFTDDPVAPGGLVTLDFTFANNGPDPISAIAFTDNLSAVVPGLSLDSSLGDTCGGTLVGSATLLSYSGGAVAAGESCTLSLSLQVPATAAFATYRNNTSPITLNVGTTEATLPPASDLLVVSPAASISLLKEFTDDPVTPGDTVNLRFTLFNPGAGTVNGFGFADDLSFLPGATGAGLPLLNACGAGSMLAGSAGDTFLTLSGASLAPGATCVIDVSVLVPEEAEPGDYSNTTTPVTLPAAVVIGDAATDVLVVGEPAGERPDLTITKTDSPDPVVDGSNLVYTITVSNVGLGAASGVAVTDLLPNAPSGVPGEDLDLVTFVSTSGCLNDPAIQTCQLGDIEPGGSASYTLTVQVNPGVAGTITNEASVSSVEPDANPNDNSTTEDTFVADAVADLSIAKSDSSDPVTAGEQLTYTLDVTNNGPSDAVDVTVADTLPAGVTLVETDGCSNDPTGVPTCSLGTVVAGTTASVTVTVEVDPSTLGTITNAASVSTSTLDPVSENDSASEDTLVVASADLSIEKSDSPDPVTAGESLTYTVEVSNAGPSDAVGVVVSDTLPGGVSNAVTSGCAEDGSGVPTCSLGTIAAGTSKSFTITVDVDSSTTGTITNTASVTSTTTDPDTGNNSASVDTLVETSADLSIAKDDDVAGSVVAGQDSIEYTVEVSNAGPSDAVGVVVSDTLPGGVSNAVTSGCAEDGSGVPTCSLGTIAAGTSKSFTITVDVDSSTTGTITNTASVTSTTTDPDTGNNSASVDTLVETSADLSIAKDDDVAGSVVAGQDSIEYTVEVSNAGPSDAAGVSVTDELPAGVSVVSAPGCVEAPAGTLTCSVGALADGASTSFTITVDVGASTAAGAVTNTASVTSTTTDPDTGNNSASVDTLVETSADLSITKDDGTDTVFAGYGTTYTIEVTNNGPSDAANVSVADTLPAGFTLVATDGCTNDPTGVPTCSLGDLAAGASASFTIEVAIGAGALGTATNTAVVGSNTADPDSGNNSASDVNEVIQGADLSITKIDKDDPVESGKKIEYTITVFNAGPLDATDVVVIDTLPAGVELKKTKHCENGNEAVPDCELGTIEAGESVEYEIEVVVDDETTGTITNTATVTSSVADPDTTNNTATESTLVCGDKGGELGFVDCGDVTEDADLSITKIDKDDPVESGKKIEYTITVFNAGPGPAVGVVVTDALPAGVSFDKTDHCAEQDGYPACTLGTIEAGDSAYYKLRVDVDESTSGTITNFVSVTSLAPDPDLGNNTASEDTLVCGEVDEGECDDEVSSPFVLPSAAAPAVSGSPGPQAFSPGAVASAPQASPSASSTPRAGTPIYQGATLPATGSNSTSPITLAALTMFAAGLGLLALGRTRRRRPAI